MANVLVFGHQNPDNDAIMSAVVLSQLLNQVEYAGNTYEACARVYFAGLTKKGLRRGDWRYLTEQEVNMLRMGSFE